MPISEKTLQFLWENRMKNSRDWYTEHKNEFQEFVLAPMIELIEQLQKPLHEIDPLLIVVPKIGKSISRVYRDIRFSKDKTLYRDIMWCVFARDKKKYSSPVFFIEFCPTFFRYGCGYYEAPPKQMETLRQLILKEDKRFLEAKKAYEKQNLFEIDGEFYKRNRFTEQPKELQNWVNRKSISFIKTSKDFQTLYRTDFYKELEKGFRILKPMYYFLIAAEE